VHTSPAARMMSTTNFMIKFTAPFFLYHGTVTLTL